MRQQILQKEIDILNKMVKSGQIEITESHSVWGARSFQTKDGYLKVTCRQIRFYGGGISDNHYTFWINGEEQFTTGNLLIAEKSFSDSLKNHTA